MTNNISSFSSFRKKVVLISILKKSNIQHNKWEKNCLCGLIQLVWLPRTGAATGTGHGGSEGLPDGRGKEGRAWSDAER